MGFRIAAFRCLYAIAAAQQGFFTSKQAKDAGFSGSTHPYHVQAGNWVREHRGIYRLILIPTAKYPELVLWQLWSSNRKGQVEGVYSHQTALAPHEFSDLYPEKLHLTVPTHFRRSSRTPGVLALHSADLPESDIVFARGCRVTSPLRTILDLAAADTLPRSVLGHTLLQMLERERITRDDLKRASIPVESRQQFEQLLRLTAAG